MANAKTVQQESGGEPLNFTTESFDPTEAATKSPMLSHSANLAMVPNMELSPLSLLQVALQNNAAIDVIERLAALQEKAQARDAEMQFNEAMNAAQSELGRIATDAQNPETHSRYATYAKLDRVLRPIYTKHGFSLSFDCGESPIAEHVLVYCYVSHRGGHTRKYQSPLISADGKGPKGGAVMTHTHATGSAMSYGMRYLLKYIFNVAIGQDDDDGNLGSNGELAEQIEYIANAKDKAELARLYAAAYNKFEESPTAIKALVAAKKKKLEEWQ